MIVKRLTRNPAADALVAFLSPKHDRLRVVALKLFVRKIQRSFVSHAKHIKDRQNRGELNVFLVLLEARDGRRTDLCQRRELLLRQI